jgi:hypothetical protein
MYSISMGPARPRRDPREVLEEIHRSDAQKVKVAITDIDGILRGKYVHKEKFLSAAQGGFGFCNVVFGWDSSDVCYDDAAYTGWHSGYPMRWPGSTWARTGACPGTGTCPSSWPISRTARAGRSACARGSC